MPSVFPELFNYSQIAPLILRVLLGIVLLRFGYWAIFKTITRREKIFGIVQLIAAFLFFLGFLTQVASLLTVAAIFNVNQKILKVMIITVALSLLFLGPGIFSLDLPL